VVKVGSVVASDVDTTAEKGDVEGIIVTPRRHCRHGEREGKSEGKDY